jgi:hypothetical protein
LRSRSGKWVWFAVLAIIAGGVYLRARDITAVCPNGDEAESAINALTILQSGLPRGVYLGMPIFENCLIEPWPDHPEYEFRDSSYSASGVAIYHGWLPLYSMALSMKAMGVAPDEPSPTLAVRHDEGEVARRVIAARLPSLGFSVAFLIFLFLSARDLFGTDSALAAVLVGAIGRPLVYMGHEARYYSATLALTTACCWGIWRVYKLRRWRDHIVAGMLIGLLFYTHMLACAVVCAMFALVIAAMVWKEKTAGKPAAIWGVLAKGVFVGAIVAVVAAPWLLLTGFLQQRAHLPAAREFLSFPADLIWYPIIHQPFLLFPLLGLVWLIIALVFRKWLPRGATRPLARHERQLLFLTVWIGVGILAFTLLIPAASYFYKRLTLVVVGPGIVWGAMILACAVRARWKRYSIIITPILLAAIVSICGMSYIPLLENDPATRAYQAIDRLRELHLDPRTKLYCTPNDQLALVYLTGLPVQSVAPIRKSFIDSYPGPMLIIDSGFPHLPLPPRDIIDVAKAEGETLTLEQADAIAMPMTTRLQRELLRGKVASVDSPPPDDPDISPKLTNAVELAQKEKTAEAIDSFMRLGCNTPVLRGFKLRDWADWWPVFFYRFVDPQSRMGDRLNYASRIKSARAEVLPNAWVFYYCPPLSRTSAAPARDAQ